MDGRTVTLCGPWRTGGRPGPRPHVRRRQSETEVSWCALGRGWGRGPRHSPKKWAWLAALCTLIMLPETEEGLCFLIGYADMSACFGISSLCLDLRHASPDVSRASKQFKAFGRRRCTQKETTASKCEPERATDGEQRGLRIATHAKRCTFPGVGNGWVFSCKSARTAARPRFNSQRVMDGYEKSAICLIRPAIRSRRAESWVKVGVRKVKRGQAVIYATWTNVPSISEATNQ